MTPQTEFDDELDYQVHYRPAETAERERKPLANSFDIASSQHYANQARYRRHKSGSLLNGIHRRGGKGRFEAV